MALTKKEIEVLSEDTKDAYSYDRYGKEAWNKSIANLSKIGFSAEEIKWVLESKYMRWVADAFQEQNENNESKPLIGNEIIKYNNRYKIRIEGVEPISTSDIKPKKNGL